MSGAGFPGEIHRDNPENSPSESGATVSPESGSGEGLLIDALAAADSDSSASLPQEQTPVPNEFPSSTFTENRVRSRRTCSRTIDPGS